jgi:glucans biosynthesis protein C
MDHAGNVIEDTPTKPRIEKAVNQFVHGIGDARRKPHREDDLDNLRSFLTALVIVHHTAIAYGGSGGWEFKSCCFPAFSLALTAFNAINQTFFMGLFFFLSGTFTRRAMIRDPRSNSSLIRSRLLRLGVPTVLSTLLLEPSLEILCQLFDPSRNTVLDLTLVGNIFWGHWRRLRGIRGPVWYLAVVIIFDMVTIVIVPAKTGKFLTRHSTSYRKAWLVRVVWTANILVSFVVRLIYPVNRIFVPLNLRPAFLPQYILAYAWGHASALLNDRFVFAPFRALARPSTTLIWSLCLSGLGLGALCAVSVNASSPVADSIERMMGGLNISALLYAIWNEVSFGLIAPGLLRVFAQKAKNPVLISIPGALSEAKSKVSLARYSYAAFLSHTLVSLGIELAFEVLIACSSERPLPAMYVYVGPLLMTIVVGVVNVLLSYLVGWILVEYLPGVGKIL